jgi:hypothetical protein
MDVRIARIFTDSYRFFILLLSYNSKNPYPSVKIRAIRTSIHCITKQTNTNIDTHPILRVTNGSKAFQIPYATTFKLLFDKVR